MGEVDILVMKEKLKSLSDYLIMKGGKKNLSKLIKVKRPLLGSEIFNQITKNKR
jgi:hypothetical protein